MGPSTKNQEPQTKDQSLWGHTANDWSLRPGTKGRGQIPKTNEQGPQITDQGPGAKDLWGGAAAPPHLLLFVYIYIYIYFFFLFVIQRVVLRITSNSWTACRFRRQPSHNDATSLGFVLIDQLIQHVASFLFGHRAHLNVECLHQCFEDLLVCGTFFSEQPMMKPTFFCIIYPPRTLAG